MDDVLTPMRQDDIGQFCKNDETIRLVGTRLFEKLRKKPDKRIEVIKSVRSDMRRLARLYMSFVQVVVASLLITSYFHSFWAV